VISVGQANDGRGELMSDSDLIPKPEAVDIACIVWNKFVSISVFKNKFLINKLKLSRYCQA
jgi:hypothetical protein